MILTVILRLWTICCPSICCPFKIVVTVCDSSSANSAVTNTAIDYCILRSLHQRQ